MKQIIRIFIALTLLCSLSLNGNADLIIFSYDRPLQLYALLESIQEYTVGIGQIMVVYRSSSDDYQAAYQHVHEVFPVVRFYCQQNPPHDFKPLTLACLEKCLNSHLLFAVDDIVIKDSVNIFECIEKMELYGAYGFFLRLGKNLNYCYATLADQKLPDFLYDDGKLCLWNFKGAEHDWGYPNSLDMTLYRKKDIIGLLTSLEYNSPNQLEHHLAMHADYSKKGICYHSSKIINLPINLVQTYTYNNCQHSYSTQQLLDLFIQGMKMDIKKLYRAQNRSSHMYDAKIEFTQR